MRIGILTHHYVKNYGAYLQMKALYETLKKEYPNANIQIVNYVCRKHWRKNILHVLHFKLKQDSLSSYLKKIHQLFVFTKYERTLPRTKRVNNAKSIKQLGLDLLVVGSDEVWNLHGSGYNKLKYGYGLEGMNLVAYAPSVGSVTKESSIPSEVKEGLRNFKKISGRDIETVDFVKRSIQKDVEKMLDPTFLYDFNKDILKDNIESKTYKYILIYDCKLTDEMVYEVKKYASSNNLKILGAGDYKQYYDEITLDLTPYEWVNLFKNAEIVITGTFHGTVFTIKNNKKMICYPTEDMRINKVSSILSDLNLKDRYIEIGEEAKITELISQEVDYSFANSYIEKKKIEAIHFLSGEQLIG